MPYSVPTTITTAQLVTADLMNTDWVENIKFLANPPACRVYHNAAQSIADNADAAVAFNSERYDTAAMHDTVTNNSRITIGTAGLYVVEFSGEFPNNSDYVDLFCYFKLNATTLIAISPNGAGGAAQATVALSTVYKFAATDYIQVFVKQDNSANAARNLQASANYSPEFSATWVGLG